MYNTDGLVNAVQEAFKMQLVEREQGPGNASCGCYLSCHSVVRFVGREHKAEASSIVQNNGGLDFLAEA